MSNLLRRLFAASGLLAAAGGCVWLLLFSPYLRFATLQVVGNTRAPGAELRHLANLPVGNPLVTLDLDAAAAGVLDHPWVAGVSARRSFPDTVVITVTERTVAAVVQLDQLYLVDSDGAIFSRAQPGDLDHPYLTGLDAALVETQPELSRRLVADGLAWLVALQEQGKIAERDISELRFSATTGYSVVLRNGGEVLLGFADRARASRLAILASQGVDFSRPHRVDLAGDRLAVVTPI